MLILAGEGGCCIFCACCLGGTVNGGVSQRSRQATPRRMVSVRMHAEQSAVGLFCMFCDGYQCMIFCIWLSSTHWQVGRTQNGWRAGPNSADWCVSVFRGSVLALENIRCERHWEALSSWGRGLHAFTMMSKLPPQSPAAAYPPGPSGDFRESLSDSPGSVLDIPRERVFSRSFPELPWAGHFAGVGRTRRDSPGYGPVADKKMHFFVDLHGR